MATCVKTSVRALELDISKSFPMFMATVPYKNAERELNSVIPVLPAGVARGRFWVGAVLGMAVPVPGARILPGTDRGTPRKGEGCSNQQGPSLTADPTGIEGQALIMLRTRMEEGGAQRDGIILAVPVLANIEVGNLITFL